MWRALRRGDPRGLEELMSRYTPYVAAVAARVLPGRPQDSPRRLVVRADVHYVDRQQTCLLAPRPSQEEAQADRPL